MKLPDFDYKKQRWDRFKRFHVGHVGAGWYGFDQAKFIQFDTGEMIAQTAKFDPAHRGYYSTLGIGVYLTSDDNCPALKLPDGTRVAKAWLGANAGHQTIVVDFEQCRAVSVEYGGYAPSQGQRGPMEEMIPLDLRPHATAYWRGPGKDPVGRGIHISRPVKLSAEQREHLQGLVAACKAWDVLNPPPNDALVKAKPRKAQDVLKLSMSDLDEFDRRCIARCALETWYSDEWFSHLEIDPIPEAQRV